MVDTIPSLMFLSPMRPSGSAPFSHPHCSLPTPRPPAGTVRTGGLLTPLLLTALPCGPPAGTVRAEQRQFLWRRAQRQAEQGGRDVREAGAECTCYQPRMLWATGVCLLGTGHVLRFPAKGQEAEVSTHSLPFGAEGCFWGVTRQHFLLALPVGCVLMHWGEE